MVSDELQFHCDWSFNLADTTPEDKTEKKGEGGRYHLGTKKKMSFRGDNFSISIVQGKPLLNILDI